MTDPRMQSIINLLAQEKQALIAGTSWAAYRASVIKQGVRNFGAIAFIDGAFAVIALACVIFMSVQVNNLPGAFLDNLRAIHYAFAILLAFFVYRYLKVTRQWSDWINQELHRHPDADRYMYRP